MLIDALDSRTLRATDCYGQRFMRAGRYPYHVLPAGGRSLADEFPYAVVVREGDSNSEMKQHTVPVAREGRAFVPKPEIEIEIDQGDLVLWNCPSAGTGFEVLGEKAFFGNSSLTNECGYSHAFGVAGDYEWTDANGSGLGGVVHVVDPTCRSEVDLRAWRDRLSNGTVVMITDGVVEAAEVTIEVGQTVFFAVVSSNGVTITDRRLLDDSAG